jgi:hypothetical protein
LLFKYAVDWRKLVNAAQGDNSAQIAEAQDKLQAVQDSFDASTQADAQAASDLREALAREKAAKESEEDALAREAEAKAREAEAKAREADAISRENEAKSAESDALHREADAKAREADAVAKEGSMSNYLRVVFLFDVVAASFFPAAIFIGINASSNS